MFLNMGGKRILRYHWTSPGARFIKKHGHSFWMVELQTNPNDFRHHFDSDVTSKRNVTQPLSQVAKKFCKCGCGQIIIIKRYHKWRGIPIYIHGHNRQGIPPPNPFAIGHKINFGRKHTEDSKVMMKKRMKGDKNPNYGKTISEEQKEKQRLKLKGRKYPEHSERMIGKNNPFYGKHHSIKTKEIISKVNKGRLFSKESREKMSQSHRYITGNKNPAWIDGRSYIPYTSDFNEYFKEIIRKRDNFYCKRCKIPQKKHYEIL